MGTTVTDDTVEAVEFAREWEQWHRDLEVVRASPEGFLAVTGLFWLSADAQRIEGIPGSWTTGPDGPVVVLDDGEHLTIDGQDVRGRHAFGSLAERGGVTARIEGVAIEVARRGGFDVVRPRRADAAYLRDYPGTPSYEPHPQWRVAARYLPYDSPRATEVGAAVDGLLHVYDAPGEFEFTLQGETWRLVAFPGHRQGEFTVLFADATSGVTTYAASRTLSVPAPDADGRTIIDFNRAVNLPCAYTDFATCPLPPAQNRLALGIEAGEQTPLSRVSAAAKLVAPA